MLLATDRIHMFLQITNISNTFSIRFVTDRQTDRTAIILISLFKKVPNFCNRDSRLRVPRWETFPFSRRPDRLYDPPSLLLIRPPPGKLRR